MLKFLLYCISYLVANSQTLQIISISSSKSNVQVPIYSSLRGGRMIYINVVGHSLMASENEVNIGRFPCIIPPGGIGDQMIMCETTDTNSTGDINNQTLVLISSGQRITTSNASYVVHFQDSFTSSITDVYPTAAFSKGQVTFFGNSRTTNYGDNIRDLGDLVALKTGEDICNTFDIVQNSQTKFLCKITPNQEAGKYNVIAHFKWGRSNKAKSLQKGTLNPNEYYQFTVVPTVSSVSPAWGNYGGQNLTIRGTGFSLNANSNKVLIDNTPCRVTSSSQTQIQCVLDSRDFSQPTTCVSGAGLHYARYSLRTSSMTDFINAVRQNNASFLSGLQEKGIRLDMRQPDLYGSNYGQTWKGYFTAITTGNYTFRGLSDDYFSWYLATSPRTMTLPSTPFLSSPSYQRQDNFYLSDIPTAENTAYLQAGESYYMEVYQINGGGPGYFRAVVQVPNNDTSLPFQAYQIDYLDTNCNDQPERVTYSMIGGSNGIINLRLIRLNSTGSTIYDTNVNVSYGCNSSSFALALNTFNSFSSYSISVVQNIYQGNVTINTTAGATRIDYIVSFNVIRPSNYQSQKFNVTYINYTGVFQLTSQSLQATVLGGTFGLTILGVQLNDLPYNIDASTLKTKIRTIRGLQNTQVDQISPKGSQYSSRWIIKYVDYIGPINTIPNSTNLTGNYATITVTVRRAYSSNIVMDPIDYRFLRTSSNQSNAIVTVNSVPSVCTADCSYSFKDYAFISSISLSGTTLNLAISDKYNKGLVLSDLFITIDGVECMKNIAPSPNIISSFSCSIKTNMDGTPIISAGQFTPTIQLKDYGYIGLDYGVYSINIPLVVTSIYPTTGIMNGGYNISIVGQGFPLQLYRVKVKICNKSADILYLSNQNMIVSVPSCSFTGSFPINITVNEVYPNNLMFTYISGFAPKTLIVNGSTNTLSRWSDPNTWGNANLPIDGDTVIVPAGFTLLIDRNTSKLQGIQAQNATILISNQTDIVIKTFYIKMIGGKLQAGSSLQPHPTKIKIVIHNDILNQSLKYLKGITCWQCKIYLFGVPTTTWTSISSSITAGSNTFTTVEDMNWKVGDQIVVASTGISHYESEKRKIVQVNNRSYTVNRNFGYNHISTEEIYSEDKLVMRAEVALLTKSIQITGELSSSRKKDGASLLLWGKSANGLQVQIQNAGFSYCGQPRLGKACIQFELNSDLPTTFIRNNYISEGYSRAIGLKSSNSINISHNFMYRVRGHGIYLQNGVQQNNILSNNLIISSINATYLQQMDLFVASYWITHPTNFIAGNRAAGSDGFGFWYEIKANPDGPYFPGSICPNGNLLGSSNNNVAHSNLRSALRIYKLSSRLNPCVSIRNDNNFDDPWIDNPSIQSVFSNWTIYKNGEDGVFAEETGNIVLDSCLFAQNYRNAVQFVVANITREPCKISNSLIVGLTQANQEAYSTQSMGGIVTARSGNSQLTNIHFYNYPAGTTVIKTCAGCDDVLLFTNGGSDIWVQKLQFNKVDGNYLKMQGLKRDVIYDNDGCLGALFDGNSRKNGTLIASFPHMDSNSCSASTTGRWDNTLLCNQLTKIRRITFTNINQPSLFAGQLMKIAEISSIDQGFSSSTPYSLVSSYLNTSEPRVESPNSWTAPFITGRIYLIWWANGIDFSHLSIKSTSSFGAEDNAIILKFNYSESRELYRIGSMRGGVLPSLPMMRLMSPTPLNPQICLNGDYYFTNSLPNRMLTICQSGKNRSYFEYTQISPVKCLYLCDSNQTQRENFIRIWSNASQWPMGRLPSDNETVIIKSQWTMILDVDPAPMYSLIIDGTLIIEDNRDYVIVANSINIRGGSFLVGNSTLPFTHKLTIVIYGTQQSGMNSNLPLDQYLLVTGSLQLYGVSSSSISTYLTQPIVAGSNQLFVRSSSGWKVDDLISLSFNSTDKEAVYIQNINSDGSFSVAPNFRFTYPATNATVVNHLTRNIKIISDFRTNIGFSIIITSPSNQSSSTTGKAVLSGVQIANGGQFLNNLPAVLLKNIAFSNLTGISFINCLHQCLRIENSTNVVYSSNNIVFNLIGSSNQQNSSGSEINTSNSSVVITNSSEYPDNRDQNLFLMIVVVGVFAGICLVASIFKVTLQRRTNSISNAKIDQQSPLKKSSLSQIQPQMIEITQPKQE